MILTGGKSSRFGSDKSRAEFNGRTLVEHVLNSFVGDWDFIIVGPAFPTNSPAIRFTQETPHGGGPVSAIAAGLELVNSEFVAIVATDIPFAGNVIAELIGFLPSAQDVIIPLDSAGLRQTLCAIYRSKPLHSALTEIGNLPGKSMKSLLARLDVTEINLGEAFTSSLLDIDTPEDLERVKGTVSQMQDWIEAVRKELGVAVEAEVDTILNVARDAAHAVERKAAPMTTFLLGHAVANGADLKESVEKISNLAKNWPAKQ